jgi:CrcB protein
MNNLLFVFLGGGVGSVLRYFISWVVKNKYEGIFPAATLISNGLSCIILGLAVGVLSQKMEAQPTLRLLLLTGICGGFSTFSTFSFETVELIKTGNTVYAIANVLISTTVCVGIVYFLVKNN